MAMARVTLPSALPLFVAAGLSMLAIAFNWPEPLSQGWELPSVAAGLFGVLLSVPFWTAAETDAAVQGKSRLGALMSVVVAGAMIGVALVHLANFRLSPGPVQDVVVSVTGKEITRGRRGRKRYHVITAPVPGDAGSTRHNVGGLAASAGGYDAYQVGQCMQLRWRGGWLWPVVVARRPAQCH